MLIITTIISMRWSRSFGLLLMIIMLISITWVSLASASDESISVAGHWPFGPMWRVKTDDKYIYVAAGAEIRVYKQPHLDPNLIPEKPKVFTYEPYSKVYAGTRITSFEISGDYLYVVTEDRFEIFDISDLKNPVKVAEIYPPSEIYIGPLGGLAIVNDSVAYIGDYRYGGIWIVDIKDKYHPKTIGTIKGPSGVLAILGKYMYATRDKTIWIYDISNPTSPVKVNKITLKFSNYISGFARYGNYAYVVDYYTGIGILNISNVTNPVMIKKITGFTAVRTKVVGNLLFVATRYEDFRIYNISDPENPKFIAKASGGVPGYTEDIAISGNYVYVVASTYGLKIFGISDISKPKYKGAIKSNDVRAIAYVDGYLVSGGDYGIWVVDISNPAQPKEVTYLDNCGRVTAIKKIDHYLYLEGSWGYAIVIVDISDITHPKIVKKIVSVGPNEPRVGYGGYYDGKYWYTISADWKNFVVVNVSDPLNPKIVGRASIGGRAAGKIDNYVLLSTSKGVYVINVSDPTNPIVEAHPITSGKIASVLGTLVAIDKGSYLELYDFSNPLRPANLSKISTGGSPGSVRMLGNYLVAHFNTLKLYDISDPKHPKKVLEFNFHKNPLFYSAYTGRGGIIPYEDNKLIVAKQYEGIYILQLSTTPDTIPPVISDVKVMNITATTVVITWKTDELSDSLVKYGLKPGSYDHQIYDKTLTVNHRMKLSNLSPNTTYYFVVGSKDQSGNYNESSEHSFTTSSGKIDTTSPTTTYKITPEPNERGWINVTPVTVTFFRSDDSGIAYTNYSTDSKNWKKVEGENPFNVTLHNTTTIWFYSVDVNGNVEPVKSVTVKIDCNPPEIYDISVYTCKDSVKISWKTNETTVGMVRYGSKSGDYDHEVSDPTFAKHHTVRLTNLTMGTYYFVIVSIDEAGNSAQSEEMKFTIGNSSSRNSSTVDLEFSPKVRVLKVDWVKEITLKLNKAPNGLSGYNITVSVENSSIAEIESVEFPDWATLHDNSTLPSSTVWIKAVDLNDSVRPNAKNVEVVTVKIRGKAAGRTKITITTYRIDDDNGNPISLNTTECKVMVVPLPPLPKCNDPPTDPNGDGVYEDLNGNMKIDFDDVVKYFKFMYWIEKNYPAKFIDINKNGRIDFDDIVKLFKEVS